MLITMKQEQLKYSHTYKMEPEISEPEKGMPLIPSVSCALMTDGKPLLGLQSDIGSPNPSQTLK
jgi:hypothetical protein